MPRCPFCQRRLLEGATCPLDGQIAPSPNISALGEVCPEPPKLVGYIVGEPLGAGGFARVWAATRVADSASVAIKLGHSEHATIVERFARESEALQHVGAPYAPRWYASGVTDGKPYIVMERIVGETLAHRLATTSTPLDCSLIREIANAILGALDALHSHELVHRDVKPENIMLVEGTNRAVLLDYGLAKRIEARTFAFQSTQLTRAGVIMGTPEYMAPEVIRGMDVTDPRTDIYAFGVLLYELFALRVPFIGTDGMIEHGHLSLRPPRPSDFAPVPAAWEQIILSCLAKDPSRRPQSAKALLRVIREISHPDSSFADSAGGPPSHGIPNSTTIPKLLAEGRHPTVILHAEIAGPAAMICSRIRAHRGHVVRQRGLSYTAIFSGFDTDDPAEAALRTARELVEKNARAALHLASVTIRRKDRGAPTVYGAAVERPETWIPKQPWHGIVVTEELRQVMPAELWTIEHELQTRSSFLPEVTDVSAEFERLYIGRQAEQETIETTIRNAFERHVPWLVTVIGDTGLGKTRLAEQAAHWCRNVFPDALVLSVAVPPPGSGEPAREGARLLRMLCGSAETLPADDGSVHRMRAIAQALRQRAQQGPVAVIVDDGDRADDALLDALEYVTLDGDHLPLWVLLTVSPSFDEQRRTWGRRTRYYERMVLGPLADESAKELAAKLLLPAEYSPAAVLERLATWAGGNPFCLREIVRAFKRVGIVRQREHGGSHYIATADVENLPPVPAWQWLAMRQLDQMPPELAACVRLCAVLGVTFTRTELERIQDALDRAGEAGTPLDIDVALDALTRRRLLQYGEGEQYSFQNGVLGDAIYELLDPAQRRKVHGHAFVLWRDIVRTAKSPSADALERLGRHAVALEERQEAASAYLQLGNQARENHKDTDADRFYSKAIEQVPSENVQCKAQALLGRGRSRYRVSRVKEALEDFQHAGLLAQALGDRRMKAELLLEEATALDWSREFATSAERVREAGAIIQELDASDLQLRLLVAEGRAAFRLGRTNESVALFERAIVDAKARGDYDALVITLLLLASQLAFAGRLDEAEGRFHEAIEIAERANDRLHLCAAHANRVALWFGRRAPARAMQDLHRAIDLAREIGNPWLERLAAHNIATLLHWSGDRAGALEFGRRAELLAERFFEPAFITTSLLLARILMTAGSFTEAARLYAWITQSYAPEQTQATRALWNYRLIGLVLAEFMPESVNSPEVAGGWDAVIAAAVADTEKELALEALYWRIRTALHRQNRSEAEDALEQARKRLDECPLWRSDFESLEVLLQQLKDIDPQ